MKKRYKVLVFQGGGGFACIGAYFMSLLDRTAFEHVDVMSGCSAGALICTAYLAGADPLEVHKQFVPACHEIFKKRTWAKINPLATPMYDNQPLYDFMYGFCGDKTFEDTAKIYPKLKFFVGTQDLTAGRLKVYDNIVVDADFKIPVRNMAVQSASAPTYFDAVNVGGHAFVDSGIIDVTAVMMTVCGAKNKLNIDFADMDVLLMGTGVSIDVDPMTFERYSKLSKLGICTDVIANYITKGNADMGVFIGNNLGLGSFTYFNPVQIVGVMDDPSVLAGVVSNAEAYRDLFLETWKGFIDV